MGRKVLEYVASGKMKARVGSADGRIDSWKTGPDIASPQ